MVKVHTIEMIEHSALSTPNVKAHADMINGALVGLTYSNTAKVTKAPAAGSDLYIVLNTQTGDKEYDLKYPIEKDEFVNVFALKNWVGKELDVSAENITGSISAGDNVTFDATSFKFKKGAGASGEVAFKAIEPAFAGGWRLLVVIA